MDAAWLEQKLKEVEKTDLIEKSVTSRNDEPAINGEATIAKANKGR